MRVGGRSGPGPVDLGHHGLVRSAGQPGRLGPGHRDGHEPLRLAGGPASASASASAVVASVVATQRRAVRPRRAREIRVTGDRCGDAAPPARGSPRRRSDPARPASGPATRSCRPATSRGRARRSRRSRRAGTCRPRRSADGASRPSPGWCRRGRRARACRRPGRDRGSGQDAAGLRRTHPHTSARCRCCSARGSPSRGRRSAGRARSHAHPSRRVPATSPASMRNWATLL